VPDAWLLEVHDVQVPGAAVGEEGWLPVWAARLRVVSAGHHLLHPAPEEEVRRRPTRRDLLLVIGELQGLIGALAATYGNDRAIDRATGMETLAEKAHQLCIAARSFDPPIAGTSRRGWPYPLADV
jgi:hypothetical protein